MMKKFHSYFVLLGICLLFTACQSPKGTRFIPKDALGIFTVNGKSMSQKVAWSALADSRVFDGLTKEDKGFDFEATGLDPEATYYVFGLADARLPGNFKFLSVFPIKNEKTFSNYLKTTFPDATFLKQDQVNFALIDDNKCIGWKDKNAISAYTPSYTSSELQQGNNPMEDILKEEIIKSFALPKDQSITGNKRFIELLNEDHDLSLWFNLEAFSNAMPADNNQTANAIISSQKKLIKATSLDVGIDFKKGKIEAGIRLYHNPSGTAVAKAFLPQDYHEELIKKIPGERMNLMLHLQTNPKGILAFIDTIGMMPITRIYLKENNLPADSVLRLFSGDLLLTVVDFNLRRFFQNFSSVLNDRDPVPYLQAAITFRVKDEDLFREIIRSATKESVIRESASAGIFRFRHTYFGMKDGYVVVAPFAETVRKLLQRRDLQKDWKLPEALKGHPISFYLNIKNTFDSLSAELENDNPVKKTLGLLDNIQVYGGAVKDNYSAFHAEIYFQNREQNSLLQILHLTNTGTNDSASK